MLQVNEDTRQLVHKILKLVFAWVPVIIGFGHQYLMRSEPNHGIYVFLDPPGYIRPQVTLQITWWFMLLMMSGLLTILLATNRIKNTHNRAIYPYIYLLFLLILVRPVWPN